MALKVDLRVVPSEFVLQQNPSCGFTLTNAGTTALEVVHPLEAHALVVNLTSVRDRTRRTSQGEPDVVPPEAHPLPPGHKLEGSRSLDDLCQIPSPGEYDLSLLYPFKESSAAREQDAESPPARLHVLPSTPIHPSVAGVNGSFSAMQAAVWVNSATSPARLMRGMFSLLTGRPKVIDVQQLSAIPAGADPRLSVPSNGSVSRDQWIAWLEGGKLNALHYGETSGATPVHSLALPAGEALLVVPLHTSPLTDPAQAPPGSALVWIAGAGGSEVLEVRLEPKGLSAGASVKVEGPRPVWIQSFSRSDGERRLVYLQAEGERLTLHSLAWPAAGAPPRPLAEWSGRLVAAGATIRPQDAIAGAVLLDARVRPDVPRRELRLIQWELGPAGAGRELRRDALGWDMERRIASAEVRTTGRAVGVLLRDAAGAYHLSQNGGRLVPLPASLGRGDLPVELTFRSEFDPVLIRCVKDLGWEVLRPDGTPFVAAEETLQSEQ